MKITDLQKKIAEILGVSSSEKELAYDIFISKIIDLLTNNITIKVPKIGFFQLRFDPELNEDSSLIYSPLLEDLTHESRSLYLNIEIPSRIKTLRDINSNVFSIGINKPLLPLTDEVSSYTESETSYAILRKSIEERVNEIIVESEFLPDFNIWDGYIRSLDSQSDENETKHDLAALTSDIEFKDDIIADDITSNLLDLEIAAEKIPSNIDEEKIIISPSDLLKDYQPEINKILDVEEKSKHAKIEKLEIEPEKNEKELNEVFETVDETNVDKDEVKTLIDVSEVDELPDGQAEHTAEDMKLIMDGYDDLLEKEDEPEIEDELEDEIVVQPKAIQKKEIVIDDELNLEKIFEDEEEDFLGLKKKFDEKIDWDWGDELKEEFGTGIVTRESQTYDFADENDETRDETSTPSDIFKSTKPIASHLFEQLENNIKNELEEADRETQYMEYSGPPPRYEFVEDREQYVDDVYDGPYRKTRYTDYENQYNEPFKKDESEKYFGKTFLFIFSAFVLLVSIIVYLIMTRDSNNQSSLEEDIKSQDTVVNKEIVASVPADTQSTFYFEENDFPRVATLPAYNKTQESNQNIINPPPERTINVPRTNTANQLYKTVPVDTRVGKTVYFDGSGFNVQLSSWRNKNKAEQEVTRLRNLGRDAFILEAYLPQKGGTWYRVRIGNFKTKEEAEQFASLNQNY